MASSSARCQGVPAAIAARKCRTASGAALASTTETAEVSSVFIISLCALRLSYRWSYRVLPLKPPDHLAHEGREVTDAADGLNLALLAH